MWLIKSIYLTEMWSCGVWCVKKEARLVCVCAPVFICLCVCVLGVELAMPNMNKIKFLLYGILKFNNRDNHANL